ncbi:Predicted arabinose efflux permease, MFS family [Kytococcus aerolatus]|uniref:Predicted arabinose efflux permease, MFS family n=1 Tax=Kytococcus aerolatus TaxID=592308 RepID=A0A212TBC4_9MICO|nr:MFS transporter [Kytococcus aerolatus]SNC63305.1 Predicted arabinose efflux permease, MFS family [Kytococcus aerolatus]
MSAEHPSNRVWERIVEDPSAGADALDPAARRALPRNGTRILGATSAMNAADQVVHAPTVLTWALTGLGAPGWAVGLLVPVREAGSMLPQAAMTPWVRSWARRHRLVALGALVQAVGAVAITLCLALTSGVAVGLGVLAGLAVLATGRAVTSLASKDSQGRTIPKGQRGQLTGTATVVAGLVALTLGVGLRLSGGGTDPRHLAGVAALAAPLFLLTAWAWLRVEEPPSADSSDGPPAAPWTLWRTAPDFRHFVTVRALLLITALAPTFLVAASAQQSSSPLTGLAPFVLGTGVASLLGGRVSGRLADRSSRLLMVGGATAASVVLVATLALAALTGDTVMAWVLPGAYFLVTLFHTGVRTGRKTYLVDMAEGDTRTAYTAAANTLIAVVLLVTGGLAGLLAGVSPWWPLAMLTALGVAGAVLGLRLPEVSRR